MFRAMEAGDCLTRLKREMLVKQEKMRMAFITNEEIRQELRKAVKKDCE